MSEEFLWVEKYRPRKIDECILPTELKSYFLSMIKRGEIQNLLHCGSAGTGTTSAFAATGIDPSFPPTVTTATEEWTGAGAPVIRTITTD